MHVQLILEPDEVEQMRAIKTRNAIGIFIVDRMGRELEIVPKLNEDQQYRFELDFHFDSKGDIKL